MKPHRRLVNHFKGGRAASQMAMLAPRPTSQCFIHCSCLSRAPSAILLQWLIFRAHPLPACTGVDEFVSKLNLLADPGPIRDRAPRHPCDRAQTLVRLYPHKKSHAQPCLPHLWLLPRRRRGGFRCRPPTPPPPPPHHRTGGSPPPRHRRVHEQSHAPSRRLSQASEPRAHAEQRAGPPPCAGRAAVVRGPSRRRACAIQRTADVRLWLACRGRLYS